jgi:hypothetical protein
MTFKLVVMPNGRAVVTTTERLTRVQTDQAQDAWRLWMEADPGSAPLIISPCEVIQVVDIELDIEGEQ